MQHCCYEMEAAIRDDTMIYNPVLRCYAYYVYKESVSYQIIGFCPFCGKKLPEELSLEYDTVIYETLGQYGLMLATQAFIPTSEKLPQEFRSDEWWKKRGL